MTAPTREEVNDWLRTAAGGDDQTWAEYMERFAALAFAAGSKSSSTDGAELVREIESVCAGDHHSIAHALASRWPRLRTALLSGSRSGEDARDAARYRWLRDKARSVDWSRYNDGGGHTSWHRIRAAEMDADIDAAMGGNDA